VLGGPDEPALHLPVGRNGVGHQHREPGSLLRLNERDVLNTLLPPPRLDLFTGGGSNRNVSSGIGWPKRDRERRDPVERLLIPDSGDSEENTELPIDL